MLAGRERDSHSLPARRRRRLRALLHRATGHAGAHRAIALALGLPLTPIGAITVDPALTIRDEHGRALPQLPRAFDHFGSRVNSAMSEAVAAPSLGFLVAHPAHFVALGFGAGLAPKMPGTFGTLVALPIAWALRAYGGDGAWLVTIAALTLIGVWAAQVRAGISVPPITAASSSTRSRRSCSCCSSPAAMRCATRSRSSCSGCSTS